jgi:thioredoxin 1
LLEFGTNWCGYCKGFEPDLAEVLEDHPGIQHIRVEDGPGRALGRSFRVKLWPNFVFLRDGRVLAQLARPTRYQVEEALEALR